MGRAAAVLHGVQSCVTGNMLGPCCCLTPLPPLCHGVGCCRLKKKDLKLFETMAALEKSYSKVRRTCSHFFTVVLLLL